jgi:hypothetical protein
MTFTVDILSTEFDRNMLKSSLDIKVVHFIDQATWNKAPVSRAHKASSRAAVGRSTSGLIVAVLASTRSASQWKELSRAIGSMRERVAWPLVLAQREAPPELAIHIPLDAMQSILLASRPFNMPYVAPDFSALRRLIQARVQGAEDQLIASASVDAGELFVWSCEPKLYRCAVNKLTSLAALSEAQQKDVQVSATGTRLHWDAGDIDLTLDAIRDLIDPEYHKAQKASWRKEAVRYGKAVARLRRDFKLKQSDIKGLSERQVRRLEEGDSVPQLATLEKLAKAHEMDLSEYLERLARLARSKHSSRT